MYPLPLYKPYIVPLVLMLAALCVVYSVRLFLYLEKPFHALGEVFMVKIAHK